MSSTYTILFYFHGEENDPNSPNFQKQNPNRQIFVISNVAKKIEGSF
jgi:hypothetical protein